MTSMMMKNVNDERRRLCFVLFNCFSLAFLVQNFSHSWNTQNSFESRQHLFFARRSVEMLWSYSFQILMFVIWINNQIVLNRVWVEIPLLSNLRKLPSNSCGSFTKYEFQILQDKLLMMSWNVEFFLFASVLEFF